MDNIKYKWYNLPKGMKPDTIEQILNYKGYITKDEFKDLLNGDYNLVKFIDNYEVSMENSPNYTEIKTSIINEWHNDYLKHKKWVQEFKNTKYSSYNDVARWHIATKYELWIPDHVIESCSGIAELENLIKKYKDGE